MIKRAAEAAAKGLSAEEYRLLILRSYRKGYAPSPARAVNDPSTAW
jgi:hypothetical protein